MNSEVIVRSIYERVMGGDMDSGLELVHPSFAVFEAAGLPYRNEYRGHDGFRLLMSDIYGVWKDLEVEINEIFGQGDRAAALIELKGKVGDSDELVVMPVVEVWLVCDGKAVEVRPYYFDTAKIASLMSD